MCLALARAGWGVEEPLRRGDALGDAAHDVDLLLIATPDASIAEVAAAIDPVETTVVAHLAGSLGLDVLAPHARRAAIHPLVALPDPETGAAALQGAWFAVAGDPLVRRVVDDLGGHAFEVADDDRAAYHAAACIASNFLVALEETAAELLERAGVEDARERLAPLVLRTAENWVERGPGALTGPIARGDEATVAGHLDALAALAPELLDSYRALAERTRDIAGERGAIPR
jgi:predicted short-subunit dehydrogenase-like oxidoreductase (DUF2520 family)